MPSEEVMTGFIPSRGFPSDHLAVSIMMIIINGISNDSPYLAMSIMMIINVISNDSPSPLFLNISVINHR
jgi:hypothetical protein